MRLKSHTHIFISLFGLDYVYFYLLLVARSACLFRHSVVYPLFFVNVTCAVSCLHRHVQRPNSWCRVQILLPTMWSEILCSLSSSIAVADGRVLVVCHVSRSLLIVVAEGRDF